MTRPRFIFCATGTLGDQLPLLAVARSVLALGFDCHMLGTTAAVELAGRRGVPFTAVAPAHMDNLASAEESFSRHVLSSYGPTLEFFARETRSGSPLVVVNPSSASASTMMAERYGLPLCRLVLTPYELFSFESPPWPWGAYLQGALADVFRRLVLPRIHERQGTHPYALAALNAYREKVGLQAIGSLHALDALVRCRVGLFPEWYAPRAADWPSDFQYAGFPLPEHEAQLPADLACWIERHGSPILFSPSTVVSDATSFLDAARRCCHLLGRPGILLSKALPVRKVDPADPFAELQYVELSRLLPHCALLVHHGGIGTTARALQAGVRQIVSPQTFDQPDNGRRVAQLGVGMVLPRRDLCGEALAGCARQLLASSSIELAANACQARLVRGDGAPAAAECLVQRFARPVSSAVLQPVKAGDMKPSTKKHVLFITHARFWLGGSGFWARTREMTRYLSQHTRVTIVLCVDVNDSDRSALAASKLRVFVLGKGTPSEQQQRLQRLLQTRLKNDPPHAVVVDKTENAFFLPVLPRAALKLVDTHDLISERMKSAHAFGAPEYHPLTQDQEVEVLSGFDRVICIQSEELERVSSWLGEDKTILAPHPVATRALPISAHVTRIGLLASSWHANVDGLSHFLRSVWPRIRQPGLSLHVYGGIASSFANQSEADVHFHGFVSRIEDGYANLHVAINPVRFGAGLKIKTVESLAHGVPLVTTRQGAAGLRELDGKALFVADEPDAFAGALRRLMDSRALRQRFGEAGCAYVRDRLSPEQCFGGIVEAIEARC